MKTSEKAHAALKKLEELWKDPERLTGTLSAILLVSPTGRPIDRWSIRNRILCAIEGTNDARTFNQWKDEDEAEKVRLIGFRGVPVFRLEDTEGEPVETMNTPPPPPLADVAEAWNLPINYAPHDGKYYGFYNKTRPSITLMVENTDPIKAMNRLLPRIETCLTAILETTHERETAKEVPALCNA